MKEPTVKDLLAEVLDEIRIDLLLALAVGLVIGVVLVWVLAPLGLVVALAGLLLTALVLRAARWAVRLEQAERKLKS